MAITLDGNNLTTVGLINSAAAQTTTSGTYIDFLNIPAGVKRVTVMFSGVSTSGTSTPQVQLGVSGTPTTSGYLSATSIIGASTVVTANYTSGFGVTNNHTAVYVINGNIVLTNLTGNTWSCSGNTGLSNAAGTFSIGGSVTLGGTLNMVRITTVNGTDTFDAGSINILYE